MNHPTKRIFPTFVLTSALVSLGAGLGAGCAGTATKDSTGEYIDDSTITAKVKAALIGDDAVKAFEIHVITFKGVVQLSGFVDNEGQKSEAGRDASGVDGVREVQNHISIK
jgi:osmotically-inducible protein OsmY